MSEQLGTETSFGLIGREVGTAGRWIRLIGGTALAGYVAYQAISAPSVAGLTELALYFVATLGVYTAATYLLGQRLLARSNAWARTAILLGPLVYASARVFTAMRSMRQQISAQLRLNGECDPSTSRRKD